MRVGAFEIGEVLGQGGHGEVRRGVHVRSGLGVAVKLLTAGGPRFLSAFRNEVRSVAGLDHPNVVLVFDHGELPDGRPWLAMELGTTTLAARRLGWAHIQSALITVLEALAHAHARGVLHLDLKPANVLLGCRRDLGEPGAGPLAGLRLADFGIARNVRGQELGLPVAVGTPQYMAPEQVRGDGSRLGAWTDLYALGNLAWELACGAPPFHTGSAVEIAKAQVLNPLPAFVPEVPVPSGFVDWVQGLLQKSTLDRPSRAADALWALERVGGSMVAPGVAAHAGSGATTFLMGETLASPELAPVEGQATVFSPPPVPSTWREPDAVRRAMPVADAGLGLVGMRQAPLVGREAERDQLWAALGRVAAGSGPEVVQLRGTMGMGKTRLAEWLGERAHEAGAGFVIRVRGAEGLAPAIARWLGIQGLPLARADRRLGEVLRVLGAEAELKEGVLDWLAPERSEVKTEGSPEQKAARLLREAARRRPAIVLVDDAHEGAEATALAELLLSRRAVDRARVLVVLTVRSDLPGGTPADPLEGKEGNTTINLGSLDDDTLELMLVAGYNLSRTLSSRLLTRAGGNPMFAIQAVDWWAEKGWLVADDGGFTLARRGTLEMPGELDGLWVDRLEHAVLAPEDRRTLESAAILGLRVDGAEWRAASPGGRHEAIEEALFAARLATPGPQPGGWSFVHGSLREALLRRAREEGRFASTNAACAAALLGRPEAAERRAFHLLEGGEPGEAVELLLRAGERRMRRAELRGASAAVAAAAEGLRRLDAPPEDLRWGRQRLLECRVLANRGVITDLAPRVRALADAREAGLWPELAPRVLELQGWVLRMQGEVAQGIEAYARAQVLFTAAGDEESVSRTVAIQALFHVVLGDTDAAEAVLSANPPDPDPESRARWSVAMANVRSRQGRHAEALTEARRAWEAALLARSELQAGQAARRCVVACMETGALDEAELWQVRALELSRRTGTVLAIAHDYNLLGEVRRRRGRQDEAEAAYRDAVELNRRLGVHAPIPSANLAILRLEQGRWAEARQVAEPWVGHAAARGAEGRFCAVASAVAAAGMRDWKSVRRFTADLGTADFELARAERDMAWMLGRLADLCAAEMPDLASFLRAALLSNAEG